MGRSSPGTPRWWAARRRKPWALFPLTPSSSGSGSPARTGPGPLVSPPVPVAPTGREQKDPGSEVGLPVRPARRGGLPDSAQPGGESPLPPRGRERRGVHGGGRRVLRPEGGRWAWVGRPSSWSLPPPAGTWVPEVFVRGLRTPRRVCDPPGSAKGLTLGRGLWVEGRRPGSGVPVLRAWGPGVTCGAWWSVGQLNTQWGSDVAPTAFHSRPFKGEVVAFETQGLSTVQ